MVTANLDKVKLEAAVLEPEVSARGFVLTCSSTIAGPGVELELGVGDKMYDVSGWVLEYWSSGTHACCPVLYFAVLYSTVLAVENISFPSCHEVLNRHTDVRVANCTVLNAYKLDEAVLWLKSGTQKQRPNATVSCSCTPMECAARSKTRNVTKTRLLPAFAYDSSGSVRRLPKRPRRGAEIEAGEVEYPVSRHFRGVMY